MLRLNVTPDQRSPNGAPRDAYVFYILSVADLWEDKAGENTEDDKKP